MFTTHPNELRIHPNELRIHPNELRIHPNELRIHPNELNKQVLLLIFSVCLNSNSHIHFDVMCYQL